MNVTTRLRDRRPATSGGLSSAATAGWMTSRVILFSVTAVAVVIGYLAPQILGGGSLVYSTFVLIAIFSVMSYGVDIILSYLGEVSLGHTLFWAGGAYTAAMLATKAGWPPLATVVAAIGVALVLAVALGLLTLRTWEFVFSLATYAVAVIAVTVVSSLQVLGGSNGIVAIPPLVLPAIGGTYTAATDAQMWPIAFGLLVLTVVLRCTLSSLSSRYHGTHGADEPGSRPSTRRKHPNRPARRLYRVRADHRGGGMAICLPAELRQPKPLGCLFSHRHADGGDPRRASHAARSDYRRSVDRGAAAVRFPWRRREQDCPRGHPWRGPSDLAGWTRRPGAFGGVALRSTSGAASECG